MTASTEPCTGVHGKDGNERPIFLPSTASTEPCTGVHGENGILDVTAWREWQLQRRDSTGESRIFFIR